MSWWSSSAVQLPLAGWCGETSSSLMAAGLARAARRIIQQLYSRARETAG